jgi:ubiquinone/menaquinone biosynthesis C-methylase UbiE
MQAFSVYHEPLSPTTSREQFDRQASHYNAQWNQWSERGLRWLLDHARAQPHHRLLDVATGTGYTALAFAPQVSEVVGIDVSEGMLAQARKQGARFPKVRFETGAAERIPFHGASFDLVTCRVAAHHFESIPHFLRESRRVLGAGGRLLVTDTAVPDGQPEVDAWQNRVEWLRDRSHVRNHSPAGWRAMVEDAGFEIEAIERCDETTPITLRDWMTKSGCTGEAAREVEAMFAAASPDAVREFAITRLPDGDTAFHWMRVVLAATKLT